MKRLVLFLVALVLMDRVVGAGLAYASRQAFDGPEYGVVNSALVAAANHDVILLGSSTTRHGYDSGILAAALGRSVYNAGSDGMDYDYDYGIMRLMARRGHPKLWVLTLDDLRILAGSKTAAKLAPNMGEDPVVRDLVLQTADSRLDGLAYASQIMRYNGRVLGIARDILTHPVQPIEGYLPLERQFTNARKAQAEAPLPTPAGLVPDPYQLEVLRGMVRFAREQGGQVVFVLPPYYVAPGSRRTLVELHQRIAADLGVPLLDYTADTTPELQVQNYFGDVIHVNTNGAPELTRLLARDLKPLLPSP